MTKAPNARAADEAWPIAWGLSRLSPHCRTQVGRRAVGEFKSFYDKDWLRTGLRK